MRRSQAFVQAWLLEKEANEVDSIVIHRSLLILFCRKKSSRFDQRRTWVFRLLA